MQLKKRSIALFLSVGMIVGILATTGLLMHNRRTPPVATPKVLPDSPAADTSMNRLYQVSTRDGRTEWKLEAASAETVKSKNMAKLKDVSVVFYLKDGGEVKLTADRGLIRTGKKDIEVSGNVVITTKDYKMITDQLKYDNNNRTLTSPTPLAITDSSSSLMADSMVYNLNKNQSFFKGNVMGIFSGKTIF
ncbi:MAG: LPS export ABC transporter periplasmic protein LptC [Deltaproteobacteria bacterium]|nr:MAG: LPS export ABC transporter periplasmic protein LptC [Deltaproteobacteria bacterium]